MKFEIINKIKRPPKGVLARLKAYPTTIISDCLQRFGVMDSSIRPVLKGKKICGPAVTVEEIGGGNLMSHYSIYIARAGDILVIDAKAFQNRANWGGLQTQAAKQRGICGIIIDGGVRDIADIEKLRLPVYSRAVTPAGPHKGWGGFINRTISCGGVVVNPGDIIVADDDGIVVVPRMKVSEIIEDCKRRLKAEKDWFKGLEKGKRTTEILNFDQKIKDYDVRIR